MGGGFVEATAGASSRLGAFGRLEAGWHAQEGLDLFGFGQASTVDGVGAGIGLRWSF